MPSSFYTRKGNIVGSRQRVFSALVATIIAAIVVFLFPNLVLAQEDVSYEVLYRSYLDQMEIYRKSHQDYLLRKSQYESFKTLQSQQDAHRATVTLLRERDEVIIKYLAALKKRILENPGIDLINREAIVARINEEISWFSNHKESVNTAGTLEDLVSDSNRAKKEYDAVFLPLAYEGISRISVGSFMDLEKRLDNRFDELAALVSSARNEASEGFVPFSVEEVNKLDRWLFDARTTQDRALEKMKTAESLFLRFSSGSRSNKSLDDAYKQISFYLEEGRQYLKEAGRFLLEIIRVVDEAQKSKI